MLVVGREEGLPQLFVTKRFFFLNYKNNGDFSNLPLDGGLALLLKVRVCLGKVLAPKEPPVR